ncbi:MAG: hypothetical protein KUG77_01280 [Nannocystaceae bacterium]|nr:hypothetical protein [Nannocystaceae bacterium]
MERRGRGRAGAWLASVVAHTLLALALLSLPERGEPKPQPRPETVELVWLDDVPGAPPGSAVEVSRPLSSSPSSGSPEALAPGSPEPASPRAAKTPRPRGRPPDPSQPEAAGNPGRGGLALFGLRGSTSSGRSGAGTVVVPPAVLVRPSPVPASPKTRAPALGPVAPLLDDEEPRSLEAAGFRKRKDGSYKLGGISSPFVVVVRPNGRVRFRDRVATVDATAVRTNLLPAQTLAGEEQLRGLKTKILRQTAELRLQMARSWSKTQMRTQLAALSTQLKSTWKRPSWTYERRRKQLFLLWDECEEPVEDGSGDSSAEGTLDQARTAAGAKARTMIVRFIRDELPEGSNDAYPATELRTLNRIRSSRQRFAPYGER